MLALTNKKISFLITTIMCIITSCWCMKLKYQYLALWNFKEYSISSLKSFFQTEYGIYSLMFMFLSYLLIYILLKKILFEIANKILKSTYNFYQRKNDKEIRQFKTVIIKIFRKIFRKTLKYFKLEIQEKEDKVTYNKYLQFITSSICYITHFVFCWTILDLYKSISFYLLAFFILFFFCLGVCFSPITKHFNSSLNKAMFHEFNLNK